MSKVARKLGQFLENIIQQFKSKIQGKKCFKKEGIVNCVKCGPEEKEDEDQ